MARRRCPREGMPVRFNPNLASLALYSDPPNPGETGHVTSVPLGMRRATCMGGPGGGLVFVKWKSGRVFGVSPVDLDRDPMGRRTARALAGGRR